MPTHSRSARIAALALAASAVGLSSASAGFAPAELAVRVEGAPGSEVHDRILLRHADRAGASVTVDGGGERHTFRGFAHVRFVGATAHVAGDPLAMRLPEASGSEAVDRAGRREPVARRKGFVACTDATHPAGGVASPRDATR